MKKSFSLSTMLLLLVISISWAQENPLTITNMKAEPNIVAPGGNVLISCQATHIQGPAFIRVVAATAYHGEWMTEYPKLYDDGSNGDNEPGDGIYSRAIKAYDAAGTAEIVFHAADKDGNEIDSEPVYLTIQ